LRSATYEFAVLGDGTSRLLGVVGLHRVDWSRRSASLGYWIRSSEWTRGLGTEAAGCVTEYGFRTLGLNRIEAHVAPENVRSRRVVGKLGFKEEGIARDVEFVAGRFIDHVQYSLLRREVVGPEDSL
jgi:RimJ/RimL family protein N-acetyltransferase